MPPDSEKPDVPEEAPEGAETTNGTLDEEALLIRVAGAVLMPILFPRPDRKR